MLPNIISYNALFSASAKSKQPAWALQVFHAMQLDGVVPDGIAYTALISAIAKGEDPERALEVFLMM